MTYIKKGEFRGEIIERIAPSICRIKLENGNEGVQMYNTIIIEDVEGGIKLNSGGWRTITTKKYINQCLPRGMHVQQIKGDWYVRKPDDTVEEFIDNRVYSI